MCHHLRPARYDVVPTTRRYSASIRSVTVSQVYRATVLSYPIEVERLSRHVVDDRNLFIECENGVHQMGALVDVESSAVQEPQSDKEAREPEEEQFPAAVTRI